MKAELGGQRLGVEGRLPAVEISTPGTTWKDCSRANRFTAGPGGLYPAFIERVLPGDEWHTEASGIFKTIPTLGPVFGTFKTQLDWFFIPDRLYMKLYHNNPTAFDPKVAYLPKIQIHGVNGYVDENTQLTGTDLNIAQIHPTGLLHRMGLSGLGRQDPKPTTLQAITRTINAIPILGYLDIFKNYYANTQEEDFYFLYGVETEVGETIDVLMRQDLKWIDRMKEEILEQSANVAVILNNLDAYSDAVSGYITPLQALAEGSDRKGCGILIKTHLSDRFNAWLNTDQVNAIKDGSTVNTSSGNFTIDALRVANKINEMLNKTLVSGGRWSDWLAVQYGVTTRMQIERPEWFGSDYGEITFEDVTQTSASQEENPLGTLGGKASGYWDREGKHTKFVDEPGFIIALFSITPRPDYSQGNRFFWDEMTTNDLHIPQLDQIGFQPLTTDEFAAYDSINTPLGMNKTVIGQQPAWTEFTTAVNESHGEFAIPTSQMYMTLNRNYGVNEDGTLADGTAYIQPNDYNQIFAATENVAENFWIQIGFGAKAERRMSDKVMPNL